MTGFADLFDAHLGETCLILGNGPSLKDVPNSFLEQYPTFGSNRIYLKFTPIYYVAINPLVVEQNLEEIQTLNCKAKFVREDMGLRGCHELHSMSAPMFSFNPCAYVYEGHTVTFVSMQLAFFMGFRTVLLVGVDHRYIYEGPPNERHVMKGDDPNHFSPDYFKGMEWHNPDLERSEAAYRMAREAFEKNGGRILNLTEGSALEVFDRCDLSEWIGKEQYQ